jgi:hypothetical protein
VAADVGVVVVTFVSMFLSRLGTRFCSWSEANEWLGNFP